MNALRHGDRQEPRGFHSARLHNRRSLVPVDDRADPDEAGKNPAPRNRYLAAIDAILTGLVNGLLSR